MFAGGTQAEECGVVVSVDLPLRIRQHIVGMFRRLLVALEQFREVIGNGNHGVGAFTLVPHYLKVFMLGLRRFHDIAQMLNLTNILADAGHCTANVWGVVSRSGWRWTVGWSISQDTVLRSLRQVGCTGVEVSGHQP